MKAEKINTGKRPKSPSSKVLLWISGLVLVNIIVYPLWMQLDLTHDRRYTINEQTREMLRQLKEPVKVKIYLTGKELPAGFEKLAKSTEQMVRSFRDISRNKVDYQVIDPMSVDSLQFTEMQRYGILGFPVTVSEGKGGTKQIPVAPFALVEQGDRKIPVSLQTSSSPRLTKGDINTSEILLEYNIANAIRKVSKPSADTIVYLTGNAEPKNYEVYDLANTLSQQFIFEVLDLDSVVSIPAHYKVAIINQPREIFTDLDKLKIDQYLMNGGHLLFNIDGVNISLDSIDVKATTALPVDLNLNDLLFNYGVRINTNIVSDADKCVDIPLQYSKDPNAQPQLFPWVYYPIFEPASEHPIVKNLNEVLGKFASSIDLVNEDERIKKTVLLRTSKYARVEAAPLIIDITSAMNEVDRSRFKKPHLIAGVLAEGIFKSLYHSHVPEAIAAFAGNIKKQSVADAQVIVFSDGDIFNNEISASSGPKEMGMYRYSQYKFNNKSLLLNAMEYMTDSFNLLNARAKSFEPSILDNKRAKEEAVKWQWINIGVPAAFVILFGIFFNFFRKRKYTAPYIR